MRKNIRLQWNWLTKIFSNKQCQIDRRRTFERNDNPKERKKWTFERKKNNTKERNLINQMDIPFPCQPLKEVPFH